MKCPNPNCGAEVGENDNFCDKCGTALVKKEGKIKIHSGAMILALVMILAAVLMGYLFLFNKSDTLKTPKSIPQESVPAQASDWIMFMHDLTHTSTSDEVVEPPLELLWKYKTGSSVWSSPAISGGIVYVGSDDGNVYALDAISGTLKWKYITGSSIRNSPAVSGGMVYVGSIDNNTYAFDATTGTLKWKYRTGNWIYSSPAVSGGVVYVGSWDKNVYALDAVTGSLKWKYTTGNGVYSSPAVSEGVVYVGSNDGNVYALDATTGALKWEFPTGGPIFYSSPAISGGVVYVGSDDNNTYALDLSTGTLKWKYTTGGSVYFSPAVSGGVVYVGSEDGNVYALNAATGILKWKFPTGFHNISSPAISGGLIYVGSFDNNTYALDSETGTLRWKYTTKDAIRNSPSISGGVVYVGSNDGNVYAFGQNLSHISTIITPAKVAPTVYPIITSIPDQKTFNNTIGMEFVLIPAGEFNMGSPSSDADSYDNEKPVHHVNISKAFYMGKYEVTQKQWCDIMRTNPSDFKGDKLPIEEVSWNDAQDFIKKLNEKEGTNKYRLPSEAEWEYAVRAGMTTKYSFGDDESKLDDYAWYDANSNSTYPVGQKKPNAWGLYDMYGNVWEWVQDIYHDNYNGAPIDGNAWEGSGSHPINRGGSWHVNASYSRSAARSNNVPYARSGDLGFRLVREV